MLATIDLASVTARLVRVLEDAIAASPLWATVPQFTVTVSGAMPETVRSLGDCQLTAWLFHVAPEPFNRNTIARAPNRYLPIGFELRYLVTAFAANRPDQEQQVMGMVLRAFADRSTYVDPLDGFTFTLTIEPETPDEASRRWQSLSTPMRLAIVYRLAAIFVPPLTPPPADAPPPTRLGIAVSPTLGGPAPVVRVALGPDGAVDERTPPVAAPGARVMLVGGDLSTATVPRLYLIDPAGGEIDVTAWVDASAGTEGRIVFDLPAAAGAAPAATPPAGVYLLRAGSAIASGDASDHRTSSVALMIGAGTGTPTEPWQPGANGVFSIAGVGIVPAGSEVLLGTVALAPSPGATPAAGQFRATTTQLRFVPPTALAGRFDVRLRVNGVEGAPVGAIVLP